MSSTDTAFPYTLKDARKVVELVRMHEKFSRLLDRLEQTGDDRARSFELVSSPCGIEIRDDAPAFRRLFGSFHACVSIQTEALADELRQYGFDVTKTGDDDAPA